MASELSPYPGFAQDQQFYRKARDLYSGNVMTTEYIVPFESEAEGGNSHKDAPLTKNRIKRSYYENLIKPIVQKHKAFISQPADVEGMPEDDPRLINIDARGTSFATFRSKAYEHFLITGRVCLLAEAPNVQAENQAEAKRLGIRPFAKIIEPERLYRFSEFHEGERRGTLKELMFFVRAEKKDGKTLSYFRRYWFEDEAINYSVQDYVTESNSWRTTQYGQTVVFEAVGEAQTFLETIPSRVIGHGRESSALDGLLEPACALLNRISVRDNIHYLQGFPVRVAGNLQPTDIEQFGTVSVANWLLFRGDVKTSSLSPADPKSLNDAIRELRETIVKLGDLRILQMSVSQTKQVQSAESKGMDERTKEQVYDEILDLFAHEFSHLLRAMERFSNVNASDDALASIKVEIDRDYGLSDIEGDLARLELLAADADDFDEETQLVMRRWIAKLKLQAIRNKLARDEIGARLDEATLKRPTLTPFGFGAAQESDNDE